MTLAPLYGLVLAGGASRRMGRDKAALQYHGRSQVEWAHALLSRHCERAFVSVRRDQGADSASSRYPTLADTLEGIGPMAGIVAAQQAHPAAAWLVLACDLPFVTDAALELLKGQRGTHAAAAFRSAHDGLPEPLCAIYEPASQAALRAAIDAGRHCPRKFLIQSGIPLIDQPDPGALDNVNTPDDFAEACGRLQSGRTP
jgi:molybdopterin-guanine dinucleotide biosynthesis protein A